MSSQTLRKCKQVVVILLAIIHNFAAHYLQQKTINDLLLVF